MLQGTASHSSLGLEAFQSLKLIRMWSLTIHLDCLMNFLAAASGAIDSPSGPTSVIMNRPSSFLLGLASSFSAAMMIQTAIKKHS